MFRVVTYCVNANCIVSCYVLFGDVFVRRLSLLWNVVVDCVACMCVKMCCCRCRCVVALCLMRCVMV